MDMDREGDDILFNLLSKYSGIRQTALDIGCGNGIIAEKIRTRFELKTECLDPYAYYSGNKLHIIKTPAEEISSLNRRYDIIYTIRAFHHISSVEKFINGLKYVIAYNGVFILVDWKNSFDTGIPESYYSLREVKSMFEKANFTILESGEGKSVFYITIKYDFKNVHFSIKNGKPESLSESDTIIKSVDKDSFEIKDVENTREIAVLFSGKFGEREQSLNEKGIKIFLSSGDMKKDIRFFKSIDKLKRCIWQPSCPVYLRFKRGEIPSYWVDNYCFVGNKNCIRYQMEERGEYHSDYMLPNGEIVR